MKKQKFCYSRFLSIILSLALLCSALVFPVSVNAENTPADPKAAAATELKTAWQEMYAAKGESFMYPNAISNKGTWVDCQGEGDRTLLLSDDPHLLLYSDIDLSRYDNSSDVYVGYGKEIHYYNSEKNESHPHCDINISSTIHNRKEGFYFYVYAENVTTNIDLKLNLGFYNSNSTLSPNIVTIPAGTNGYIRLKDTDFFPAGFHSVIGNKQIFTMWVNVLAGFDKGAKLKFGSFQWVNSNTDLGLDSLTTNELLVSALKLHTENVYFPEDVEKFETALAALKACYDKKELAVLELKAAWEEMETNKAEYGYSEATPRNTSSDEQKDKLGKYYYQIDTGTLVDTNCSAYSDKKLRRWQDNTIDPKWQSINKEGGDGFYFYIYTNEAVNYPINLTMVGSYTGGCNSNADLYYTIPAGTPAGTYIKVSDRDLFTEGHKTLRAKSGDKDSITLFFTSKSDSDISIGALFRYKRAASSTATGIDFVNAANALDISSYGNTEAFTAALANANAAYADDLTASELKKAFIDMMPTGKSTGYTAEAINAMTNDQLLVAATSLHTNYGVYDAAKLATFKTALEAFKAANFTPEAAARITLKAAYNVLQTSVAQYGDYTWYNTRPTGVNKVTTTEDEDKKYLGTQYAEITAEASLVKHNGILIQDSTEKNPLSKFDGFYFYIKVTNELTQDFKFGVNAIYSNSEANYENICVLHAGTKPGYYLFTDKDFYSQGYSVAKSSHNVDVIRVVLQSPYSGGNICVGSGFGYKYGATGSVDFVNWELDRCVNYLLRDINENSRKTTDEFNALFEEVKQMCAGKLYNGDFSGANSGYQLNTKAARPELGQDGKPVYDEEGNPVYAETETKYEFSSDNLVYTVDGWNKNLFDTYFSVEKNTNYVLTYRYKSETKNAQWQAFGVGLLDGSGTIINGAITHNNADIFTDAKNFDNTNWINGLCNTNNAKWINVSISFNSGENTFLKLNAASMGRNQYTIDYFKLTKASDVEIGNVNRDSEVDILDLVVLKEFLNDGDTEIAFEAAKVNTTGETVDNDDFKALRSKLLNSNS